MKALLLATLIGASGNDAPNVDQQHIWFEGPAAYTECVITEAALHFGTPTSQDGDKVSTLKVRATATATRTTRCIKFN
jgi:hypothetical protein